MDYYSNHPEWKSFFSPTFARHVGEKVQEQWIDSTGTKIHLDLYINSHTAPTIIYCHGLSSCGRMMGHLVSRLFAKGYNVICPDLVGFGMTTQKYGSGTMDQFVQNLLDVVDYTKTQFTGPRFLTGISMGGGLSYYAAARGADVSGIACFCLMDFSSPLTWTISHHGYHLQYIVPLLRVARKIFPHAYLPIRSFLNAQNLCSNDQIIEIFKTHPLIVRKYTFEAAYSLLSTPPSVPFEKFLRLPVMVVHAEDDRLIPEWISRLNYDKLPGKKKYLSLKNCGHIPLQPSALEEYSSGLDRWFKETQACSF